MQRLIPSIVALLPLVAASSSPLEKRDYVGQNTQLTFFGYPVRAHFQNEQLCTLINTKTQDNCDDSGCYGSATAYDCQNPDGSDRNYVAGGDGTFNNPLSVAIQPGGNFQQCQIGYTTYLQKFVIFDGLCVSCATDHMDIWVQSSCSDDADSVCACEDQLTPDAYDYVYYGITADDPSVFNVDTTPLYSGGCTGHTYATSKLRRDAGGELQSINPERRRDGLFGVEEKWLKSKRQTGACSENICQCSC